MKTTFIGLFGWLLLSCERGELLNSEADIIGVTLPELPDSLKIGTPRITNTRVRVPHLAITPGADSVLKSCLDGLQPEFELTPGATIDNVSDQAIRGNYNYPQHFLVTSQDRQWTKTYEFSFFRNLFYSTHFSFEYFEVYSQEKPYYIFFEIDTELGKQEVWDSGNFGFSITAGNASGDDYPTGVALNAGKSGHGAKLVTRSTGVLGSSMGMPIAAGNLFLGTFELNLLNPLQATHFGVTTVMDQPVEFSFWAKYKAGENYTDAEGNVLTERIDRPEIYAVLYEPELDAQGDPILLDGTNVTTAENIVSIAEMTDEQAELLRVNDIERDEYVQITVPFVERIAFDREKQLDGKYNIAIVFSSSAKGGEFEGAVGSTLYVDEVDITTKE